jgi:hypothetical protein
MRFGAVSCWAGLRSVAQLHCRGRVFPTYCAERGWNPRALHGLYALRLTWHRVVWWCKDGSRPLRRKLGF